MPKKIKGFTLLELSIVILVIATLIFGVLQGGEIVRKAKTNSAAALTRSSIVGKMDDLLVWFETTSPGSLNAIQAVDNGAVTTWNNISNSSTTENNATGTATYISGAINGLPVLRFNGTSDLLSYDGSKLANTNYTVLVVAQQRTAGVNYFLGGTSTADNNNLHLANGSFNQYNNDRSYTAITYNGPEARIYTFIFSSAVGKTAYVNGTAKTLTCVGCADKQGLTSYNNAQIGAVYSPNFYNGDIAEVIIFTRALSDQERKDVEEYLGKKWGITVS